MTVSSETVRPTTGPLDPGLAMPSERAPSPRLYLVEGGARLFGYDVDHVITVGRHPDNQVQLLDTGVSKFHLRVTPLGRRVLVEDLDSQNGTLLNDRPMTRAFMHEGDELVLGDTRLLFTLTRRPPRGAGPAVSLLPTRAALADSVITEIEEAPTFPSAERLVEDGALRAAYTRLRATFEMVQAVSSAEDLSALAETLLDRVLEQLPADRGALLMLDPERAPHGVTPLATRAQVDGIDVADMALPRETLEHLLQTRRGVITSSCLSARTPTDADPLRSTLTLPLAVGDEVVGLLHLESSSRAEAFAEHDLDILSLVARPAALALANARLMARVAEDARARQALERFLSPSLVDEVRRQDLTLGAEGRHAEATILFADIRGFTAMAEPMAATDIVAMLNQYFARAVDVVFRHQGVLDKFMGDGLMAVWGVPAPSEDHAARALRAAVELRATVEALNLERAARQQPALRIGVGLASGEVVAGLVGAPERLEYTVVGNAVNVASRLCDQAGPQEILAAADTCAGAVEELGIAVAPLGARLVEGRRRPVEVVSVAPAGAVV